MLTYLWKLTHKQRKSADRLSSIWKGILTQSFIARNWIIRNLWWVQLALQEEQLHAECTMRLKNFYLSKLLCIWSFLFKKKSHKKQNMASTEISHQFLASKVPILGQNKATNSSNSNHPFFSCSENPCTW